MRRVAIAFVLALVTTSACTIGPKQDDPDAVDGSTTEDTSPGTSSDAAMTFDSSIGGADTATADDATPSVPCGDVGDDGDAGCSDAADASDASADTPDTSDASSDASDASDAVEGG